MKTIEEIKAILSDIEPSEAMYSKLSEEDIPALRQLMQEAEPWLAARVIFALSRVANAEAHSIIVEAAKDQRKEVRVAVASSSGLLPHAISNIVLDSLIEDSDIGVKKYAIKSVSNASDTRLKNKVKAISLQGTNEVLKTLAAEKLSGMDVK